MVTFLGHETSPRPVFSPPCTWRETMILQKNLQVLSERRRLCCCCEDSITRFLRGERKPWTVSLCSKLINLSSLFITGVPVKELYRKGRKRRERGERERERERERRERERTISLPPYDPFSCHNERELFQPRGHPSTKTSNNAQGLTERAACLLF